MNILVITQMYSQPSDDGGYKPTKTVNYFVKEWVALGHNVVVMHCPSKFPLLFYKLPGTILKKLSKNSYAIVPSAESRKKLIREENGANIFRLPMLKVLPGQAYSSRKMNVQAKEIQSILDGINFQPETIIGHFANPSTELVSRLTVQYKAKSSIVFHHDCSEANIRKYRLDQLISKIGAIGARSIVEAKEIQKLLHLSMLPFVCCSGVPNDMVERVEKACKKQGFDNGCTFIYVGGLLKLKNVDAIIKAFAGYINETGDNKSKLNIVGDGAEVENLKTLVEKLAVFDKVIFCGHISRNEVLSQMKEAQVLTLISESETFGMVCVEAMLQGCITIVSKNSGFDGIIQDGVNGFICTPGDSDMLQNIYKRIAEMSEVERNRIGENAIDTAVDYSERAVAQRYLQDVIQVNDERYK